ncbi:DUF2240 family protein [archaeon]|nr:DUF2240 family protein [archaeon]
MAEIDFDELLMKIVKASGLDKEAVIARINAKVNELSGLVSKRGAAHIIANSFGIQLHESKKGKLLALKDLVSGLNNISVSGVVTRVFPINEFERKNGRKGKVASVIINDGTAESRLVFWNDLTEVISTKRLNEGDFVKAYHVRSKKGRYGMELHLSSRSRLQLNPEGEKPPKVKSVNSPGASPERFLICDLQAGLNAEVRGCLVNLYERSPFYDVCPKCNKSLKDGECVEHGEVEPAKALIVSAVFDDGTGSIRAVFFKNQAEALLGCSTEHAVKLADKEGKEEAVIMEKKSLLGDEYVISGKVNHNDYSDTLELMVNSVVRADPVKEANRLLN